MLIIGLILAFTSAEALLGLFNSLILHQQQNSYLIGTEAMFMRAEAMLAHVENHVLSHAINNHQLISHDLANAKIEMISQDICGLAIYRITINYIANQGHVALQSTLAAPFAANDIACQPYKIPSMGRMSWREL